MKLNKILYAWRLFKSVRLSSSDGFSQFRAIRYVCRYHCLVEYHGWDVQWKFRKPQSREQFIDTCNTCVKEMEKLYINDMFASHEHYSMCHSLLLSLRLLAERMPIVWWLTFKLHL